MKTAYRVTVVFPTELFACRSVYYLFDDDYAAFREEVSKRHGWRIIGAEKVSVVSAADAFASIEADQQAKAVIAAERWE